MKILFGLLLTLFASANLKGQILKDGIYTFTVAFSEWEGKSNRTTCKVIIKGDSIIVLNNGSGNLTGKKGEIIDRGIIMFHTKSGQFIIAKKPSDAYAPEVNGCEGPSIIDFKRKIFWTC